MTNHTTAALLFLLICGAAVAADVNLNGVIGTKALVVIDSGKPRLLAIAQELKSGGTGAALSPENGGEGSLSC